jgi:hypothetical protein
VGTHAYTEGSDSLGEYIGLMIKLKEDPTFIPDPIHIRDNPVINGPSKSY